MQTSEAVDADKSATMAELPPECLTDGTLDDPVLIITCGEQAVQQLESVVVKATIDLGAMFMGVVPADEESIPAMEMEIRRVFPNDVDASLTIPGGGEVRMIFVDGEAYINDPMSNGWIKVDNVPDEMAQMFLTVNTFEHEILEAGGQNVEWNEVLLSDDRENYLVSFEPPTGDAEVMFGPAAPEFRVTLDTMNFLYESVSLVTVDSDGVAHNIVDIQYSRHNEPLAIEAPSEYTEAGSMMPGAGMVGPDSGDGPRVIGLSKNSDGYVQVKFSDVVTVTGDVSLYVIDPATGGWELPLLGGAGTDTLTFDNAPEGEPSLIPGESVIPGLIFATAESQILDLEGNMANPVFEEWVYPE